jgi:phosphoribosylamine--glycine ligase
MGDPECQTILPRLKSDLFDIINSCCSGNLSNTEIEWHKEKSLCIVLCSKGYPDNYENNILIENIDQINLGKNDYCYHAGTIKKESKIYSCGGRVLNFVSLSNEFKDCRKNSISLIHKLNWSNGFYRKDIGYKVIDQ